jgi:F0F1-type ATP synthase assembly protein I
VKERVGKSLLLRLLVIVAAVLLGPLAIGLALDRLLGSAPFGLFVCAAVGILAGTIVIVRISSHAIAVSAEPGAPVDIADEGSDRKEDRA